LLLSVGIIIQTQWDGLGVVLLFAAGCIALLSPEDQRKLMRLSKPLLLFTAVAVFISGIQFNFEQSANWADRLGFSYVQAGETFRRLFVLLEITIIGLVFTLSTSTSRMKQGLELALRPLKRLGIPTGMLALAASLVLRFIPLILEEAERFAAIARARGKRASGQGQIHMRDIPVFVIPLLIALFQAVEELIIAMELKAYLAKPTPTPPLQQRNQQREKQALLVGSLFFVLLIGIRFAG
jgi:energy-coupling factor transporter transmembrane protein EcfT